jgi:hypothetical protein
VDFCTTTQLEQGCKPLAYLPAAESTILRYLGFLSDEGLVHETSLNPYLAAINQAHEDIGLPRPALGHYCTLVRKGFAAQEGDLNPNACTRMPVPADVMLDILHLGLRTDDSHALRMCTCLVVCYSWYNRADTGIQLLRSHVTLTTSSMTINTKSKTCARNVACPITRRFDPRHDPDALVFRLLQRWHSLSDPHQDASDIYWSLPGDTHDWQPSIITKWLRECLQLVHRAPPAGESWSGHSMRAGGASASLAIGVDLFHIMSFGQWKSLAAVQRYLSVLILPDRAAYIFYGWLRPPPAP